MTVLYCFWMHWYKDLILSLLHCKHTFSILYTHWDSFCLRRYKINLVKTLVHWAPMVCSYKLEQKLKFISKIFYANGYPLDIMKSSHLCSIAEFHKPKRFGSEKCSVHLRLSWIGETGTIFAKQIFHNVIFQLSSQFSVLILAHSKICL